MLRCTGIQKQPFISIDGWVLRSFFFFLKSRLTWQYMNFTVVEKLNYLYYEDDHYLLNELQIDFNV